MRKFLCIAVVALVAFAPVVSQAQQPAPAAGGGVTAGDVAAILIVAVAAVGAWYLWAPAAVASLPQAQAAVLSAESALAAAQAELVAAEAASTAGAAAAAPAAAGGSIAAAGGPAGIVGGSYHLGQVTGMEMASGGAALEAAPAAAAVP
jgi:hypothetical protein